MMSEICMIVKWSWHRHNESTSVREGNLINFINESQLSNGDDANSWSSTIAERPRYAQDA